MTNFCIETINGIEDSYFNAMSCIRESLREHDVYDVGENELLMLLRIGKNKLPINHIMSKKLFSGTNCSYNINKLVKNGYMIKEPSKQDKRSSMISLSKKGISLFDKFNKKEN